MGESLVLRGFKELKKEINQLYLREKDFRNISPKVSTMFLTYRCNSKCKTCNMWKRTQDKELEKEIGIEEWKLISEKLVNAGVKTVEIFGGNVLLRKNLLIELSKFLYEKGISIHIPTNQIGLDDDIAKSMAMYVDKVYLSIDGLGDGQDSLRGVLGASDVAETTVEKLLRFKKEAQSRRASLKLVCNCTVSKFNIDDVPFMVDYAISKGFDEVHFEYVGEFNQETVNQSKIMGIIPNPQYMKENESILVNKEQAIKIKEELKLIRKKYKKSNPKILIQTINIDSLSVEDMYMGKIPHKKCYIERTEVTVDPYGNIVMCPFITNYITGNLVTDEFDEIWNNERHRIFRDAQNKGNLPMCKNCILGVQRNPGIVKSIQRIYFSRIRPKFF